MKQILYVERDRKASLVISENWNHFRKLTESQSQDDDAELNSQQEETGDFPQDLKRQQTSWESTIAEQTSCDNRATFPGTHGPLHMSGQTLCKHMLSFLKQCCGGVQGNSRFSAVHSTEVCLVCEECQPCSSWHDRLTKSCCKLFGYLIREMSPTLRVCTLIL